MSIKSLLDKNSRIYDINVNEVATNDLIALNAELGEVDATNILAITATITSTLNCSNIQEISTGAGVDIMGVQIDGADLTCDTLTANNLNFTGVSITDLDVIGTLKADNIVEYTLNNGVNITNLKTDTIDEKTLNNGVNIDGVLLKDNDVSCDEIITDTITEKTLNNGVNIENVLLKDGEASLTGRKIVINNSASSSIDMNKFGPSSSNYILRNGEIAANTFDFFDYNSSLSRLQISPTGINILDSYFINGNNVLSNNTLGSGIVNSSLTSVGTLSGLTVSGTPELGGNLRMTSANTGDLIPANGKIYSRGIIIDSKGATNTYEGDEQYALSIRQDRNSNFGCGIFAKTAWQIATADNVLLQLENWNSEVFSVKGDNICYFGGNNATISGSTGNIISNGSLSIDTITSKTTNADLVLSGNGLGIVQVNDSLNLSSGSEYRINGTSVLSNNTLGSGIVNSSLTNVGTLTGLTVSGTPELGENLRMTAANTGDLIPANGKIYSRGIIIDSKGATNTYEGDEQYALSVRQDRNSNFGCGIFAKTAWQIATADNVLLQLENWNSEVFSVKGDRICYFGGNNATISGSNGNINAIIGNYQINGTNIITNGRILQNLIRYDMSDSITDQLIFRKTHRSTFGDKIEKNIKLESRFSSTVLAGFGGELDFSISTGNLGDIDLGFLRWNLATTASGGRGDISIFSRPNSTDPYNEFRFRGDGIMLLKTIGGINDTLNIMDNLNFENNEGIRWGSSNCQIIGNASNNNINITSNNLNISNTLITTTQAQIISGSSPPLFVQRNAPNTSNVSWNVMEICAKKPSGSFGNGLGTAIIFSNDSFAGGTNKTLHAQITTRLTNNEDNTAEILISPYNTGTPRNFIFNGKSGHLTMDGTLFTDTITSNSTDTNLTLSANGSGIVQVNDSLNLSSGSDYKINGSSVLSATTLGSGVVNSSLTSIGTLTSLRVDNVDINANSITANNDDSNNPDGNLILRALPLTSGVVKVNSNLKVDGTATIDQILLCNDDITIISSKKIGFWTGAPPYAYEQYISNFNMNFNNNNLLGEHIFRTNNTALFNMEPTVCNSFKRLDARDGIRVRTDHYDFRDMSGGLGGAVVLTSNGFLVTSISSRRYKKDIQEIENINLSILDKIKPVSFKYNEKSKFCENSCDVGFIAEDLYEIVKDTSLKCLIIKKKHKIKCDNEECKENDPDYLYNHKDDEEEEGEYEELVEGINYNGIHALSFHLMKQMHKKINELEINNLELQNKNIELEEKYIKLEAEIEFIKLKLSNL
jgi:hypothetical protein